MTEVGWGIEERGDMKVVDGRGTFMTAGPRVGSNIRAVLIALAASSVTDI